MFSVLRAYRHLRQAELYVQEQRAQALRQASSVPLSQRTQWQADARQCLQDLSPWAAALDRYDRLLGVVGLCLVLLMFGAAIVSAGRLSTGLALAGQSAVLSIVASFCLGMMWLGSNRLEYAVELAQELADEDGGRQ